MSRNASNDQKVLAKYIAMVVRNAMEDFHCDHLSDAQMKELNPIIRNAIYTALYAANKAEKCEAAKEFFQFQIRIIPEYWEEPELIEDYLQIEELFKNKAKKTPRKRKQ